MMNSTSSRFDPLLSSKSVTFQSQSVCFCFGLVTVYHFNTCGSGLSRCTPARACSQPRWISARERHRQNISHLPPRKWFTDPSGDPEMVIKDIIGGLRAWTRQVDPGFPEYWTPGIYAGDEVKRPRYCNVNDFILAYVAYLLLEIQINEIIHTITLSHKLCSLESSHLHVIPLKSDLKALLLMPSHLAVGGRHPNNSFFN